MKEARRLLLVNPNDVADVVRDIGEPWLIPQTFLAVVLVPPLRDCRSAQRGKLVIVDALGFGFGFGFGFGHKSVKFRESERLLQRHSRHEDD